MKKNLIVYGVSVVVFLISLIYLWNTDHGFIAFLTAFFAGAFIAGGARLITDDKFETSGMVAGIFGALIAVVIAFSTASSDAKEAADKVARAEAKAAKEAAMTPAERAQQKFENERAVFGHLLRKQIKESAFDPDALKLDGPKNYKDGVCVKANGKNRFGAYVGWQEHCYIYKDGKWSYSGPN